MKIKKAKDLQKNKDWRIMIYAKPGTGKTSLVQHLEGKTLVLDMDDSTKVLAGLENVDIISFDRVHPHEFITDFIKEAPELIKSYDNLVIDNISSFERDWFVERGRSSKNGISNEIQDYSQWTNYFARIMTSIYFFKDINILVTAWENQREITTERGQVFNQYAPQIRDSVRDGLMGLTDIVGRMITNPDTGNRGVILEGNDAVYAKNRLDRRKAAPAEELFLIGGESDVSTETVSKPASDGSQKSSSSGE
ncbi:AAA family ATPase [Enterococcus avium]|jgi:phage nucleotide-binding protein|uniref:AAA family ATPase n=1 Tax=Enterococcus avium TaxID=33945 RepID=UPI001A9711BE|nr:AAA family ATPase [Enterococcus avium]MBO1141476.1 AAA family ATPase [Enterococcus avium]DAL95511.1 MAG TPA: AAA domain protein [Caudoviricetes sp.]